MAFKVAIDGPGGAGKSTISKAAARELGFVYIDTGAMYRALAYVCLSSGIVILENEDKCVDVAESADVLIKYFPDGQHVFVNGEDVTGKIRTPEVSMGASEISAYGKVRKRLVEIQRGLAEKENVIMDGRDIGTKVLPDAEVKIFLTASATVRAKRRFDELVLKDPNTDFNEVLEDINRRDKNDSTRKESPLMQAEDAILLDTSDLTLDESISAVIGIIKDKMGKADKL
ncbi:MAG: (d)CMP kinase [Clostridia bacterium]|nr:(d)CMP kinase [Clostridia bacterium]